MLMEKVTLTLRRAVECAPSRTLMETNGKDLEGTYRFTTFNQIE
jgi:hypothetical protein